MPQKVFQPLFKRSMELVFVKPFRPAKSDSYKPGDAVPETLRLFHKRSLYKRRIVGPSGHPWTDAMIKAFGTGVKPEVNSETPKAPDNNDDLTAIKGIGKATTKKLNEAGIFTFKQLARLKKDDDRVKKPDWISQAKKLAKG